MIQHTWIAAEKSRRSRYRLVVYGDSNAHRDFDSLDVLIDTLQTAGVYIDMNAVLPPDPQASSILLSQAIGLSDSGLSSLGLKPR